MARKIGILPFYGIHGCSQINVAAMQIFGGYGCLADYDIERFYRDIQISTIYEGTTEIQKNVVARIILRE